ncbi:MAG: hypothetical protein JWN30_624 [Bacilli bacterium]|nr:hypothetical protein [Bacilli bacterium]
MIKIRLTVEGLLDLPDGTEDEFAFAKDESGGYVAEVHEDGFEHFLRHANLITYKNHLKEYDDGDVVGEFTLAE